jgi:glycosyltransferase involved in cell wall biosynthesis
VTRTIVVDARALSPARDGISTYLRELVPRLAARLDGVRTSVIVSARSASALGDGVDIVIDESRPMWPQQNLTIPALLRRLAPDLYLYPAHDPPVGRLPCPMVMAVHDITPLLLRPYFETLDGLKRRYLAAVTGRGLRRAVRVLAASEATRAAIGSVFGAAIAAKTEVIHYGPSGALVPATAPRHLLYLGTDRPHKNVPRIVDAYASATREHPTMPPLVLSGGFRDPDAVTERVVRAGIANRTSITGHVTDDEAVASMAAAVALLYPSLAEGFGFPIVDAMSIGVPVITSNRSSCIEIAGDGALLVDPLDVGAIAAAMASVSLDPGVRADLVARGRRRAEAFSWDVAAAATATTIGDLLVR